MFIFSNTNRDIVVQVPSGSTTYNKLSTLSIKDGMPSNVTLSTY